MRRRTVETRRSVGERIPQKRADRVVMRFFGSCALLVAAISGCIAGGFLTLAGTTAAGASPAIVVNCPGDNLQDAINSAATGSTLMVRGTCTGNFYINKDLTLSGPAVLDGGGVPTTYGAVLNVMTGTVVLNNLVLQDGVGIDGLGGGLWNSGQLTLNDSMVTHNNAFSAGGIFNVSQLTLNGSRVTNNTATSGEGGILNCGDDPAIQAYGLCTGPPATLTLNASTVSNNVAGSGDGGGIYNDIDAALTLNVSTVSQNTSGGNGGGIENHGTATLIGSILSGNTSLSGGGIQNNGTATLDWSAISNNSSTGESSGFGNGGGISSGPADTDSTTLNYCLVRANTANFVGGGIFAGGGPMSINGSIVTGNSAAVTGGGLLVWNGPTTVTRSTFSDNPDQAPPTPDTLPGVWVAPTDYLGFTISPSFVTTHSTFR